MYILKDVNVDNENNVKNIIDRFSKEKQRKNLSFCHEKIIIETKYTLLTRYIIII